MSLVWALDWAAALLADTAFPPLESLVCCQLDASGDALEVSALWNSDSQCRFPANCPGFRCWSLGY